jgi:hypothetical protein
VPEPVLISVAAALAGKAATSVYDFVKTRFKGRHRAEEALSAAEGAEPDSPQVVALADELERAEREDPAFSAGLREEWARFVGQRAEQGGVANQITGHVTGKVVQARDIEGGISF